MGRGGGYVGSKLVWGAAFFLDVAFLFYNSLPLQINIQNFKKNPSFAEIQTGRGGWRTELRTGSSLLQLSEGGQLQRIDATWARH